MAVSTPLFSATGEAIPPAGLTIPAGFKFAQLTPSGRDVGAPEFFNPSGSLVTETAPGTFVSTARFQGFPEPGNFFTFARGFAGFLGTLAPLIVGIPALAGVPLGGAAAVAAAEGGGAALPALNPADFFSAAAESAPPTLGSVLAPELTFAESSVAAPAATLGAGVNLFGAPGGEPTGFNLGGVPSPDLTGAVVNVPESGVLAGGSGAFGGGFSIAKALRLLPLAAGLVSLQGHTGNADLFTNPVTGANPSGGELQDPLAGLASGLAGLLGGGGEGGGGGGGGEGFGQRGLTFIPTQGKRTGFLLLALVALAAGGVWFYLKRRKQS